MNALLSYGAEKRVLYPEDLEMVMSALEDYSMVLKNSNEIARCEVLLRYFRNALAS